MKPKPEIVVQKRQPPQDPVPVVEARCSCGKRALHKCSKESLLGGGKMCFK